MLFEGLIFIEVKGSDIEYPGVEIGLIKSQVQ